MLLSQGQASFMRASMSRALFYTYNTLSPDPGTESVLVLMLCWVKIHSCADSRCPACPGPAVAQSAVCTVHDAITKCWRA